MICLEKKQLKNNYLIIRKATIKNLQFRERGSVLILKCDWFLDFL